MDILTFILFHSSLNYLDLKNVRRLIKGFATFFTLVAFQPNMNYEVFPKFWVSPKESHSSHLCGFYQMNSLMFFKERRLMCLPHSLHVECISNMKSSVFRSCYGTSKVFATFFYICMVSFQMNSLMIPNLLLSILT